MRARLGLAFVLFGLFLWVLRRTTSGIFWRLPDWAVQGVALLALFGLALCCATFLVLGWGAVVRAHKESP